MTVSDLHIWGPRDPIYRSLLALIRDKTHKGDLLVLAGDLFDLFVGGKDPFATRYRDFIRELARAGERGVRVHYIEGNHDFHLKKVFGGIRGVSVHSGEVTVEMGGKRFFIAHGDLVDRKDYRYRMLRGFFRSPVAKLIVKVAPGEFIERIGRGLGSAHGGQEKADKSPYQSQLQSDRFERLRKVFRNFAVERISEGYDFVILGHCHDLDEMHFKIGNRSGQYVNVGYPRVHGSFVSWIPGEDKLYREPLPPAS